MNLTHYYWYFQSVIPLRICDMILKYGKSLEEYKGITKLHGKIRSRFSSKFLKENKSWLK